METIHIQSSQGTYPVMLGDGALDSLNEVIQSLNPACTSFLLIADETVYSLHKAYVDSYLDQLDADIHLVPSGEQAKSFHCYEKAMGAALEAGLDRHSVILALGGGATGDLAGFVAATYMRGIRFIQIPTTVLAHDSAVGGKTAINHPLGKNMTGSFHQPSAVIYDSRFLDTLPLNEFRSGFAEVIKHALIADGTFLQELMRSLRSLEKMDPAFLLYCLKRGIEIKRDIVELDEKELGVRAFLNFGHTYGHAVEAWSGYGNKTHGECVMIGMVFALYVSRHKRNLSFDIDSFRLWIKQLGYDDVFKSAPFNELLTIMKKDKKTIGKEVRFVLLSEVGNPELVPVSGEELEETFLLLG
ncbi:3-dehydroquinate synthase [Jeotgalibacillus aurantiacus]|uniref:3-dehydroquinate synthase n=1 Tax=Jeotgalibacillus aurantiacus TaxID=2763266 RepID=UPI001D0BCB44|nr:3-dehydroquinate synthase [Jeotgalibacillus aurantiacus]